ncbi:MAG: hypothetical protein PHX83_02265 [Acidobacteriia bacterium]|nr:hypothetical protein [Terriglobia bacterium]
MAGAVPPAGKSRSVGIYVVVAIVLLALVGGGLLVWHRIKVKREAQRLAQQTQTTATPAQPLSEASTLDDKTKDTLGRMNALLVAVEAYRDSRKKLPISLADLGSTLADPQMRNDGWGNPLIYLVDLSNGTFVLRSVGPDGKRDTDDDIRVSDDSVASWREQHHEVLDEWRVSNLDLYQKLSGETLSSETQAALQKKQQEREKAKADAAAKAAADQAAREQQAEMQRQQEAAAQLAEQQRQQMEAQRRVEEERQRQERAEAERQARLERMNFVETFDPSLRRWAAASFQGVTEKGKPAMRIIGFGLIKDSSDWDNYTATLDVKINKEAVNFVVRAVDRQNFYFLKLTDDKAKLYPKNSLIRYIYQGGRYVNNTANNEAVGAAAVRTLPMKIKRNELLHVLITASGSTIRTMINGQVVDVWQDSTFSRGSFGFNCSPEEQATVTSFQIHSN